MESSASPFPVATTMPFADEYRQPSPFQPNVSMTTATPPPQLQLQHHSPMLTSATSASQQQQQTLQSTSHQMIMPQPGHYGPVYNTQMNQLLENDIATHKDSKMPKRAAVDIDETKLSDTSELLQKYRTEELQAAFAAVSDFNLIDNETYLDTLYERVHAYEHKAYNTYTLNYLVNLYKTKYLEYFQKYSSLESYVIFVLYFLINRSVEELKRNCVTIGETRVPRMECIFNTNNLLSVRKRRNASVLPINSGTIDAAKRAKTDDNDAKSTTMIDAIKNHPFLKTDAYMQKMMLFEIGKLLRYCIPTDFALTVIDMKPMQITKYINQTDRAYHQGVKLTFDRPVVSILSSRLVSANNRTYTYFNVGGLTDVIPLVEDYTKLVTDQPPFTLGIKNSMVIHDPIDGKEVSCSQNETFETHFYYTMVSSFDCLASNTGKLSMKGFTNKVFVLRAERLECTEEQVRKIENEKFKDTCEKNVKTLNEWYDEIDGVVDS